MSLNSIVSAENWNWSSSSSSDSPCCLENNSNNSILFSWELIEAGSLKDFLVNMEEQNNQYDKCWVKIWKSPANYVAYFTGRQTAQEAEPHLSLLRESLTLDLQKIHRDSKPLTLFLSLIFYFLAFVFFYQDVWDNFYFLHHWSFWENSHQGETS